MWIVFFSTRDVFEAEEQLKENDVDCIIVPTPATDKAYCGVCISTENEKAPEILSNLEFNVIRGHDDVI